MAQTKTQIQALLAQANTAPRHRFGQNFMIDANIVRAIADAADITPDDLVIEVGPGTGTLTDELLARAGRVIAVEIDRDLVAGRAGPRRRRRRHRLSTATAAAAAPAARRHGHGHGHDHEARAVWATHGHDPGIRSMVSPATFLPRSTR